MSNSEIIDKLFVKNRSLHSLGMQELKEDELLNPYAEGDWLKLNPIKEKETPELPLDDEGETEKQIEKEDEDKKSEEEEDNIVEGRKHMEKREESFYHYILRGPIWNYGLRKLSLDSDYYNDLLFGLPVGSMKTPEDLILKGEQWTTSKPITSSLAVFLLRHMKKMNPEKTALLELETRRSVTYVELVRRTEALACGLHWVGLQPGQVLAIISYNSLEALIMLLACLRIGAIAALVDPSLSAGELGVLLRNTAPRMVFTEVGKTLHKVESAIGHLGQAFLYPRPQLIINSSTMPQTSHYFLFHQLIKEQDPQGTRVPGPTRADPLRPIMILYTGTPEMSKGCLLSERFFTHSKTFLEGVLPEHVDPSTTVITTLPLFWNISVKSLFNHYIDGHRIVFSRGVIPEPFLLTSLRKYEVFGMLTTRATLMNLLDWPARPRCPQLKAIAVTGTPMRLKDVLRVHEELFKKQLHILQIYGLVETGSATANTFLENKYGSVGKLFPNFEMKVLEEGSGIPLGPNQEGELCLKSPTTMLGYYNNPEANEKVIDSEGFIHTGDLGYYDGEGFVYVIDRIKDMIKWKTYSVSPSVVEAVLLDQPEVKETLVFGMFDEEEGELVTAVIILEYGHEHTDIASLENRVNDLLPYSRKIRGGIHVFTQFPHSSIGKPLKGPILKEVMERTLNQ